MKSLLAILVLALLFSFIQCEDDTDNPCPYGWEYKGKYDHKYRCRLPVQYGRGGGYPWKFGDGMNLKQARKRCEDDNPTLGCEKHLDIYYPKCKEGFSSYACCLCKPYCPNDWYQYETPDSIHENCEKRAD